MTVAKSVEIPPMEEVIVDAFVDRHGNQDEEEDSRLLVEMHPNLPEQYDCVLAFIVDAAKSTAVPVHLFNQHSYLVVVRQNSMVGQVELVDVVSTISRCKNPNEMGNFSATGWVPLKEKSVLPNKDSWETKSQRNVFIKSNQEPLAPLSEHIMI